MPETLDTIPVGRLLHELLERDRSLTPTERKLLEVLLLHPPATTARDLSRATSTNLQALYSALERLTARGLVATERSLPTARFRVAHPSVVLQALVEPGVRAVDLARELEVPLRRLYERDDLEPTEDPSTHARSTTSPTAAASWLMDLLGSAGSEIWFLGDDAPWFGAGTALEAALARTARPESGQKVRMLAPPARSTAARPGRHARLERSGVSVRYSDRPFTSSVILDRRWLMLLNEAPSPTRPVYLRLEAPGLCRDLLVAAEAAWDQASTAEARTSVRPSAAPSRPARALAR